MKSEKNILKIPNEDRLFTDRQLRGMILPLFFEQLLVMLVGIADTFVVSTCGEAAVSGVSLVNSFNTIFIYLFTALATGGAVVVSQYIGRGDEACASESVSQLLMVGTLFSLVMAAVVLGLHTWLLNALFGSVEPDVMAACETYLRISAYSFPAIAVYNAGAALYRSLGRTGVTMYISIASNLINVAGNCIGVFVLHAGVAGVAWPSLIARAFSAVYITVLCFREAKVRYIARYIFRWNSELQKNMLAIAVPNAAESGVFQFVKVALSSMISMFGTYQIAANGISQSFWSLAALVGVAMGPVFVTVIGQCMGAGDIGQADYYFKKLLKTTVGLSILWEALLLAVTPPVLQFYTISAETRKLIIELVILHNVFNALAFPFCDSLGRGLRACGDVKFPTVLTIISTICVRLALSILLAQKMGMGVIGIGIAMVSDWIVRGGVLWFRYRTGKWKTMRVI